MNTILLFFAACYPPHSEAADYLKRIDSTVYANFTQPVEELVKQWIPSDTVGLIGRNKKWNAMYSPRFQMGSGKALRVGLVAGDYNAAKLSFYAIKAGTGNIDSITGRVFSSVPDSLALGQVPNIADLASAAAFFLGDACLGFLASEKNEKFLKVIDPTDFLGVKQKLLLALNWLQSQTGILKLADAHAPNRLLFDALAFQACGCLQKDSTAFSIADEFVSLANELHDSKGYFREGEGFDVSYQAVAIEQGQSLILSGFQDPDSTLYQTLQSSAIWLAGKVDSNGAIDTRGSTRTCEGGEVFLGEPKLVSIPSVFDALAYASVIHKNRSMQLAAERVVVWKENNPGTNPCHSTSIIQNEPEYSLMDRNIRMLIRDFFNIQGKNPLRLLEN